jgi:hypothetical protein
VIEALPAALATSLGKPGTLTPKVGIDAVISSSLTEPCASASTKAAFGNVTARISGLISKRSPARTASLRPLARRNVRMLPGAANTARLLASSSQNSSSDASSSSASSTSSTGAACEQRLRNAIRSACASWVSGLVGR